MDMRKVIASLALAMPALTAVAVPTPTAALTVPQRWAAPGGSSSAPCTRVDPCDIVTAINDAPANADVTLDPGHYGSPHAPLHDNITDASTSSLVIHGEAGRADPVIYSDSDEAVTLQDGSHLSDVQIEFTGVDPALLLDEGSTADHVRVFSSSLQGACQVDRSSLTTSLCVDSAGGPADFMDSTGVRMRARLTGDTLISKGGTAVTAYTGSGGNGEVDLINTIAEGSHHDLLADDTDGSGAMYVYSTRSDVPRVQLEGAGTYNEADPRDVPARPKFVDARHDDYQEAATSPTIDRGKRQPTGATDLAGLPRTIGPSTDIGAYERPEKPTVGAPVATRRYGTALLVSVPIDGQGLRTVWRLLLTHGHRRVETRRMPASSLDRRTVEQVRVGGLARHTPYDVVAVVTNRAGSQRSPVRSFTTR